MLRFLLFSCDYIDNLLLHHTSLKINKAGTGYQNPALALSSLIFDTSLCVASRFIHTSSLKYICIILRRPLKTV